MRDAEGRSGRGRQPPTGTASPSGGGEEPIVRESVVQQAIGILMHRLDLLHDACELLRSSARRANADAAELARTLVNELDRQRSSASRNGKALSPMIPGRLPGCARGIALGRTGAKSRGRPSEPYED